MRFKENTYTYGINEGLLSYKSTRKRQLELRKIEEDSRQVSERKAKNVRIIEQPSLRAAQLVPQGWGLCRTLQNHSTRGKEAIFIH